MRTLVLTLLCLPGLVWGQAFCIKTNGNDVCPAGFREGIDDAMNEPDCVRKPIRKMLEVKYSNYLASYAHSNDDGMHITGPSKEVSVTFAAAFFVPSSVTGFQRMNDHTVCAFYQGKQVWCGPIHPTAKPTPIQVDTSTGFFTTRDKENFMKYDGKWLELPQACQTSKVWYDGEKMSCVRSFCVGKCTAKAAGRK